MNFKEIKDVDLPPSKICRFNTQKKRCIQSKSGSGKFSARCQLSKTNRCILKKKSHLEQNPYWTKNYLTNDANDSDDEDDGDYNPKHNGTFNKQFVFPIKGRPKGSKTKKTTGKKPGRPKGSKSKNTTGKKPGRPKGSKSKNTTGKKRGRPTGSKSNKKRK